MEVRAAQEVTRKHGRGMHEAFGVLAKTRPEKPYPKFERNGFELKLPDPIFHRLHEAMIRITEREERRVTEDGPHGYSGLFSEKGLRDRKWRHCELAAQTKKASGH